MAKSLSQIQSQINKLQKEADTIRAAVIARIRKEMAQHGLTAEDLVAEARSTPVRSGRRTKAKVAASKSPKYADGSGNTWGGIGKRPAWIREALQAGRALEEFLVGAVGKPAKPAEVAEAAKPALKRAAAAKKASPARKAAAKKAAAPKKAAAKRPARKKAAVKADAAVAES